jgi:hypothetical protein
VKRGVAILAFLLIVTIAGGVLTANVGFTIPTMQQTNDPAASFFEATPNQAVYLVLMIGFILVNVLGAGLTMAFLFWLGNREVKRAAAMPYLAELRERGELPE